MGVFAMGEYATPGNLGSAAQKSKLAELIAGEMAELKDVMQMHQQRRQQGVHDNVLQFRGKYKSRYLNHSGEIMGREAAYGKGDSSHAHGGRSSAGPRPVRSHYPGTPSPAASRSNPARSQANPSPSPKSQTSAWN